MIDVEEPPKFEAQKEEDDEPSVEWKRESMLKLVILALSFLCLVLMIGLFFVGKAAAETTKGYVSAFNDCQAKLNQVSMGVAAPTPQTWPVSNGSQG